MKLTHNFRIQALNNRKEEDHVIVRGGWRSVAITHGTEKRIIAKMAIAGIGRDTRKEGSGRGMTVDDVVDAVTVVQSIVPAEIMKIRKIKVVI